MTSEALIIRVLTRENETLRERIAYLETTIVKSGPRYDLLGLTHFECRMLAAMADGKLRSKEQLLALAYSDRLDQDLPELKIVDVWVCKIRKKLIPHGIKIDTAWGQGYALSQPGVARLREVLAPFGGFDGAEAA